MIIFAETFLCNNCCPRTNNYKKRLSEELTKCPSAKVETYFLRFLLTILANPLQKNDRP